MTRKPALAAAFLLTAAVSFFVIAAGSSAGIFAWSGNDGEAARDGGRDRPGEPVATAAPGVTTEYVFVDQPVNAGDNAARDDHEGYDEDEAYEHEGDDDDHDDDDDRDEARGHRGDDDGDEHEGRDGHDDHDDDD